MENDTLDFVPKATIPTGANLMRLTYGELSLSTSRYGPL